MDIRYSGQNISVTQGMKDHLREKLIKLERYSPKLVESHVVLKKEKYLFETEITLLAKDLRAYGEGKSKENIYTAIDQAYGRIEKQLKKFREKVKDRYKAHGEKGFAVKASKARAAWSVEPAEVLGRKPAIIPSVAFAPKPMSVEEASLQLELSSEPFLAFLNAAKKQVNVIFKRDDGNHGLIEPNFKEAGISRKSNF